MEHSGCHATFLDFNITKSNGNLYDKREDFSFFVVRMTTFITFITFIEILRIARSPSCVTSFYEKTSELITRMEKQAKNRGNLSKQVMEAYETYQLVFQKYDISNKEEYANDTFRLGCSSEVEIIVFRTLGRDAPTYNLSYLKAFLRIGARGVEVLKFLSLGSYGSNYHLSC